MKELVLLQGDQLDIDFSEIDFDLDKTRYSICPKCSAQIIQLSSGCKDCGWSEDEKLLGDKLSIPCEIKEPHKEPVEGLIIGDRGSQFDVQVSDQVISIAKLYVFPHLEAEKKCRTTPNLSPSKKSRRKKGKGTGSIHYREIERGTKTYKQAHFHYERWTKGNRLIKSSKYIPKKLEAKIIRMNNEKAPVEKILQALENKSKRRK